MSLLPQNSSNEINRDYYMLLVQDPQFSYRLSVVAIAVVEDSLELNRNSFHILVQGL